MKASIVIIAVCGGLALAGCGDSSTGSNEVTTSEALPIEKVRGREPEVELPKGAPPKALLARDLKRGNGETAEVGDELTTQFVAVYYTNGKLFESSWDGERRPFTFELGADESSPGWERGMPGMKVGGRRELIIPPKLTSRYGVPPGSGPELTLIYVVELLDVG